MNRYVINPLASQDLNQIADYFAENNVEAGEQFFQEFKRKCEQLINFPNSGKSYKNIHPTLQGLSIKNYIIFYRNLEDRLEILRVVNGRRNLRSLFVELN